MSENQLRENWLRTGKEGDRHTEAMINKQTNQGGFDHQKILSPDVQEYAGSAESGILWNTIHLIHNCSVVKKGPNMQFVISTNENISGPMEESFRTIK